MVLELLSWGKSDKRLAVPAAGRQFCQRFPVLAHRRLSPAWTREDRRQLVGELGMPDLTFRLHYLMRETFQVAFGPIRDGPYNSLKDVCVHGTHDWVMPLVLPSSRPGQMA